MAFMRGGQSSAQALSLPLHMRRTYVRFFPWVALAITSLPQAEDLVDSWPCFLADPAVKRISSPAPSSSQLMNVYMAIVFTAGFFFLWGLGIYGSRPFLCTVHFRASPLSSFSSPLWIWVGILSVFLLTSALLAAGSAFFGVLVMICAVLAGALDQQGIFRPVTGILGRCCWGWFSLASQPLLAPGVDTLQFLPGPDPYGLQPLFGTTSETPVSLQTNLQVSTLPSPPPHEIFQGFSANHAVLITPQGLVYVEVPVFADAATYRRLVGLQADPPPGGGIMRLWQPLPLLPHVQFLEIHCLAAQAPCVLDFRPMGWRIMTVCVDPPVSACSAVQAAVASGADVPEEWIEDCHASRLGVLHRERAVRPSAPLLGGPPFVLLFFPHVFGVDDSSSDGQVGGGASLNPDHTVLPPLREESGGRTPPLTSQVAAASNHSGPISAIAAGAQYGAILDTEAEPDHDLDGAAYRPCAPIWWLRPILFLAYGTLVPRTVIGFGFGLLAVVDAVQIHSAPASSRDVVLAPDAAVDAARLATPAAHRRLQSIWYHFGDFGYGNLWPVPGSTAHDLRFSLKVWHPEQSHTVELLGATDAVAAASEVRTLAGRTGRTQVYAAAGGLPAGQVHLVAAPRDRSHVTVFFDAGVEVWCVDVPRHTNSEYLLSVACSLSGRKGLASTDALQMSSTVSTPLRNGDVLGVRLETDPVEVDLSEHLLAQADTSASVWLDPVRHFTLLTAASGATTYQIARSAEVDVRLLRGLVRHVEGPGGTFLELPVSALLRRPVWTHCALDLDHVVFRVTEAWDPNDVGLFFVFRGTFPSYSDFVRHLRQDPSPGARWLRSIRPYGVTVLSWEHTQLHRPRGSSFWYVHCSADIARAQLHHVRYVGRQPSIIRLRAPPQWPRAQHRWHRGTQTDAAQEYLLQGATIWQSIPRPFTCELGRYPDTPSALDNLWCSAWQIRCVVPCIPGHLLWAIRDGDRLLGMCTTSITWDLVAATLRISMWELPQAFLHGDGSVWPYPKELSTVAHKCVSVSHDTAEAVSCLGQDPPATTPAAPSGASERGMWPFCLYAALRRPWLGFLCAVIKAHAVRLDEHIPSAADAPCTAAMPFRDYRDPTRTCTMSWTLELSRQTHGFAVEPNVLGRYIERFCSGPEVLIQFWRPGQSSVLLQERVRSASRYLEEHLGRLGYLRDVHELCIAFDTSNHALDVILVPPTGGTWWILQDQVGRELLRPVTRYYVDNVRFRILTISPEGIGQAVCPSYQVRQSLPLPQGARGRVTRDHPEFEGGFRQGILHIAAAAAASLRGRMLLLGYLLGLQVVAAAPSASSTSLVPSQSGTQPLPTTMRIWTYNVRSPLDLPWRGEGYPTRWLHEYVCDLFKIHPSSGASEEQVHHLLFVPRSAIAGPQPRYWLLHIEDRACVIPGQHPFDWDIVAQHIQDLYTGLRIPPTRPALGIQSQLFLPDYPLPDRIGHSDSSRCSPYGDQPGYLGARTLGCAWPFLSVCA